jgi:hypothetical protein
MIHLDIGTDLYAHLFDTKPVAKVERAGRYTMFRETWWWAKVISRKTKYYIKIPWEMM